MIQASGTDWKPNPTPTLPIKKETDEGALLQEIAAQGEKVRDLKAKKADKPTVDVEVKVLLALKADYKSLTGQEWKPGNTSKAPATLSVSVSADSERSLLEKIADQGNKVRDLKSRKAEKAAVDAEVKTLLLLKDEYKKLTGVDWKPGATATASPVAPSPTPASPAPASPAPASLAHVSDSSVDASISSEEFLVVKVNEQGNHVRNLKSRGAPKVGNFLSFIINWLTEFRILDIVNRTVEQTTGGSRKLPVATTRATQRQANSNTTY